jgi:hypothetical protein
MTVALLYAFLGRPTLRRVAEMTDICTTGGFGHCPYQDHPFYRTDWRPANSPRRLSWSMVAPPNRRTEAALRHSCQQPADEVPLILCPSGV